MKKIILYFITAISMIIIPVTVTAAILLTMAVNENFHVSIIKRLDLVKTFIETKNIQIEKDIRREVEKKTGLSQFKPVFDSLQKDYEEKTAAFRALNKSDEHDKIEKQIDELDDLEWIKSSDQFRTEKEFDLFKKNKRKDLKLSLEEIEKYRDKNEDTIDKAEDEMDAAKDRFEDAKDDLEDKEDDAKDIVESRRGEFMNEMYSDIARIEPILTEKLNSLFIEKELKPVIRKYLDFMTSWHEQKKAGIIHQSRLNIESGMIENTKRISLPPLRLSLIVKTEENGTVKDRNILSEVFVDTIRDTPGLKSPWVLTRIFKLSDSWITESVANSIFKGTGLSLSDGVLRSDTITVSGEKAELLEKAMMLLSVGKYAIYIAAGLTLILLLLIFGLSTDKIGGIKKAGVVLKYPSVLIVIAGIAAIIVSLKPGLLVPPIFSDPVNAAFFDKVSFVIALHLFAPVSAIFFILSLIGGILIRLAKRKG